jgi:hypothetical protein
VPPAREHVERQRQREREFDSVLGPDGAGLKRRHDRLVVTDTHEVEAAGIEPASAAFAVVKSRPSFEKAKQLPG